jgi:hypothetical protein
VGFGVVCADLICFGPLPPLIFPPSSQGYSLSFLTPRTGAPLGILGHSYLRSWTRTCSFLRPIPHRSEDLRNPHRLHRDPPFEQPPNTNTSSCSGAQRTTVGCWVLPSPNPHLDRLPIAYAHLSRKKNKRQERRSPLQPGARFFSPPA